MKTTKVNEQTINPDAKTAATNAIISAVNSILLVLGSSSVGDGDDDDVCDGLIEMVVEVMSVMV
jgi:molybdopterin biosynthesis enzyme